MPKARNRLVLVEDDHLKRQDLVKLGRESGYVVRAASDAKGACTLLNRSLPTHLLITEPLVGAQSLDLAAWAQGKGVEATAIVIEERARRAIADSFQEYIGIAILPHTREALEAWLKNNLTT